MNAFARPAAILAVDVVGYSRLMGESKPGAGTGVWQPRKTLDLTVPYFGDGIAKFD